MMYFTNKVYFDEKKVFLNKLQIKSYLFLNGWWAIVKMNLSLSSPFSSLV